MIFSENLHMEELKLPIKTITKNRYFDSVRYQNNTINPKLSGFNIDKSEQNGITDVFKNGWYGKQPGDSILFHVNGGMVSIQYKKTIKRVAPIAVAIIDGDEANAIRLDANFDESWGDCIYMENLLIADEVKEHSLEIRVVETDNMSDMEFYLVSVIVADRTQ